MPALRPSTLLSVVVVVGAMAWTATAQANVTPPGTNGKIAFASNRDNLSIDCSSVNPSTSDDKDCGFEIYTMNPDGTGQARLTNNTWKDDKPSWSPDGTKIAFESRRDCAGHLKESDGNCFSNIYVMDADGNNVRQLTFDTDSATHPTWSPDGTKIAFERGDPKISIPDRIYVIPSSGGPETLVDTLGDPRAADASQDMDILPAWSPDGNEIAFTRVSGLSSFNSFAVSRGAAASTGTDLARFLSGDAASSNLANDFANADLSGVKQVARATAASLRRARGRHARRTHARRTRLVRASQFQNNSTFWEHTFVQPSDGSGPANPIGNINGCDLGKLFLTDCQFDSNPAWAPDGARLAIQRRVLGCLLDDLPTIIGNQLCFNQSGHATNDVDIFTTPRDGSGEAVLNAGENPDCGPQTLSQPDRPQCFSDHKPAYAPQNNLLAFHSDREPVTKKQGTNIGQNLLGFQDCGRFLSATGQCLFNVHTMSLLGTNVSSPLGAVDTATGRNPDWQPVFLPPTSFAFVPSCSTDGVIPVGTQAFSPGKGAVAVVRFQIDGGPQQDAPVSNGFATINVPNGQHTLTYFAVNQAGVAEAAHSTPVVVDTVNHCQSTVGVAGVRRTSCAPANFTVRFAITSAVGIRRVQVFVDNKRVKTSTSSRFSVLINVQKLRRGSHVLRTEVTDVNGATVSSVRTFRTCPRAARIPARRHGQPRFTG